MKILLFVFILISYIEFCIIAWKQGKLKNYKEENKLLLSQLEIDAHKDFLKSVGKDVK